VRRSERSPHHVNPKRATRGSGRAGAGGDSAAKIVPAGAGYSGTPLPKKLGIKPGSRVAMLDAPPGFARSLGTLPDGALLVDSLGSGADLIVWFVRSCAELESGMGRVRARLGRDGVWIAWPKKASGVPSDLSENAVREAGLATGIVDFKVCAVDTTWSALKFQVRRT